MHAIHLPPELMTAAERAGFRAACAAMRDTADRMASSARLIGGQGSDDALRGQILEACGKAVHLAADRAEATLHRGCAARVSLARRGG